MLPGSTRLRGLLLVLLLASACGHEEATRRPGTLVQRPGIVVIVVDTLRADAVARDDTSPTPLPSLRVFARGATTFADAIAPGAWTPQSMPSLLTGLTPPHTGCQGMPESSMPPLPGAVHTLAERLKAVGYTTAAYSGGGFVSPSHGVAQGFDAFLSSFDTSGPEACVAEWSKRRTAGAPFLLLLQTYAPHDPYGEKLAREMASAALSRIPASPTIHRVQSGANGTLDVVAALKEPGVLRDCAFEWFFDGLARPANTTLLERADPTVTLHRAMRRWIDGGYLEEPQGREAIEERFRAEYQRGLLFTEAMLARTFAALEAARLPPDTIVVVTSDHGEAHGEHGYLTHERHLHQEIVHVPLLVRAPGRMPSGAVVQGTCSLVDLVPTLLVLVGAPAFEGELDGRSLLPLANGREHGHPVLSTADRQELEGRRVRNVRELTVRDERRAWSHAYDLQTGEVVREYVIDLVEDPEGHERRPAGTVVWDDAEFCRLVAYCRSLGGDRSVPLPAEPPCAEAR